MGTAKNLIIFFFVFPLNLAGASHCPSSFKCSNLGSLKFPLSDRPGCGLFMIQNCSVPEYPSIQFGADGYLYIIDRKLAPNQFLIWDPLLHDYLYTNSCLGALRNVSLPLQSPSVSFTVSPNLTMFTCYNRSYSDQLHDPFRDYNHKSCSQFDVYYSNTTSAGYVPVTDIPPNCSMIQVPINSTGDFSGDLFGLMSAEFVVEWTVSGKCNECHSSGGKCLTNNLNEFHCSRDKRHLLVLVSTVSGAGVLSVLGFVAAYIFWQRKKRKNQNYLLSRNISLDPSSKPDCDGGSSYFGIPIFPYTDLEVATNNFDPSKELGDGGFGTVYYGKLRDGREVAIKRLFEHNCRQVEQFMNEIKILTSLRHKNLVSLYGCTSRRSRELLLIYEYISNGTVADHLYRDRARPGPVPLSWPVRLSIALETADALSYLHKSDIIHRDVKTCNILLDSNFSVKVADFGLSRLFPNNVTHVSTAPQGTPGYVDPDYHQCYQLTDKSDVYSFGVVLIELISSLPAVDITRKRDEINLANLGVNRIQRCAFDELIDSSLGYESDAEVARMTRMVAELAFRCLQVDKDMRPSMDEVVEFLKDVNGVQAKGCDGDLTESPVAVVEGWISGSSTTASCVG